MFYTSILAVVFIRYSNYLQFLGVWVGEIIVKVLVRLIVGCKYIVGPQFTVRCLHFYPHCNSFLSPTYVCVLSLLAVGAVGSLCQHLTRLPPAFSPFSQTRHCSSNYFLKPCGCSHSVLSYLLFTLSHSLCFLLPNAHEIEIVFYYLEFEGNTKDLL